MCGGLQPSSLYDFTSCTLLILNANMRDRTMAYHLNDQNAHGSGLCHAVALRNLLLSWTYPPLQLKHRHRHSDHITNNGSSELHALL